MAVLACLLSVVGCDGALAEPELRLTCGGWQENPALLGTWESNDFPPAAVFTLTEDSIMFGEGPQTFAYAVCHLGDEDLLIVNDIEMRYTLDGDALELAGRSYFRHPGGTR
jgi:hypothetical protein